MNLGAVNPYIWPFPGSLVHQLDGALRVYQMSAVSIFGFVAVVMTFRGAIALITGAGLAEFARLTKDLFLYAILIAVIPDLLHLLAQFVGDISRAIPSTIAASHKYEINQAFKEKSFWDVLKSFTSLDIIFAIADMLPAMFWWTSALISSLFTSVLVGATPLLLFSYVVLQFGDPKMLGKAYLCLFLWPIFWNILGFIGMNGYLFAHGKVDFVVGLFLSQVFLLLQLISPILFAFLLRGSGVGGAVLSSLFTAGTIGFAAKKLGLPLLKGGAGLAQSGVNKLAKGWSGLGNVGGGFNLSSSGSDSSSWGWRPMGKPQIESGWRWNFSSSSQLSTRENRVLPKSGNWPLLPDSESKAPNPYSGGSPKPVIPSGYRPTSGKTREIRLNQVKGVWGL